MVSIPTGPYQLEAKLDTVKAYIGELIQHKDRTHQDSSGSVVPFENLNQPPIILTEFQHPVGFS